MGKRKSETIFFVAFWKMAFSPYRRKQKKRKKRFLENGFFSFLKKTKRGKGEKAWKTKKNKNVKGKKKRNLFLRNKKKRNENREKI